MDSNLHCFAMMQPTSQPLCREALAQFCAVHYILYQLCGAYLIRITKNGKNKFSGKRRWRVSANAKIKPSLSLFLFQIENSENFHFNFFSGNQTTSVS